MGADQFDAGRLIRCAVKGHLGFVQSTAATIGAIAGSKERNARGHGDHRDVPGVTALDRRMLQTRGASDEAKTPNLCQQIPPAGSALWLAPSRAALEVLGVVDYRAMSLRSRDHQHRLRKTPLSAV